MGHFKISLSCFQGGCSINFRASDTEGTISVEFVSFIISDCDIKLQLSGGSQLVSEAYKTYLYCDSLVRDKNTGRIFMLDGSELYIFGVRMS